MLDWSALSRTSLTIAFLFLPVPAVLACQGETQSDDRRLTELLATASGSDNAMDSFKTRTKLIIERFRSLWCDRDYLEDLANADNSVVSIRLRAALSTAFYAQPDWVLDRLRAVVEEAYARGLADSKEVNDLIIVYQTAGRFDQARQLREQFFDVEIPEVPDVVAPAIPAPEGARLVWRIEAEENRLRGNWLPLRGNQLFIVTSPGCGFCRAAARDLLADEWLAPVMRSSAYWVADRSMANTFHSVVRWNEQYTEAPTLLVDDPDDWPISEFDQTPQFHFVRDGDIIQTLAGWQGGPAALQAIADGFGRLNLLDIDSLPNNAFDYADRPSAFAGCPERDRARELIRNITPIQSREELDRHLAAIESGAESPLKMLSEEGQTRFLSSMYFQDTRLVGFSHAELQAQLEPRQIHQVISLFGMQYFYAGHLFDIELLSKDELELKNMLDCNI